MVQPPSLAALHELRWQAPATGQQLRLLRTIKNDIVGHGQRKSIAVKHGLVDCLADLVASSSDHQVQLQAVLIIGSLAEQGPALVSPILASNIVRPLLLSLPPSHSPTKLVTASLRALNALAVAEQASPSAPDASFTRHIFSASSTRSFLHILRQSLPTSHQQAQIALTANLIASCCHDHPAICPALVKSGILDALASLLANYASALEHNPNSYHAGLDASALLDALSALTRGSPYRGHRLIYSPDLRYIFSPPAEPEMMGFNQDRPPTTHLAVDYSLPRIVVPFQKSVSFPSSSSSKFDIDYSKFNKYKYPDPASERSFTSPFCAWLMYFARVKQDPRCRLAALRLLSIVNNALNADIATPRSEFTARSKERERNIALFAVPIAVKMVQDAVDTWSEQATAIKDEACEVLAQLIANNPDLQKAALEAGAVKHVSQLFRKSFDPVTLARPMWSANPRALEPQQPPIPSTTLGDEGLPQEVMHAMMCRAGALDALAAIAEKEDANRKAVIESGIIPSLIDSLTPLGDYNPSTAPIKTGNTVPVLLAACRAATSMSRSVSLLRTSLIDAGIAKPVFALLKYPDLAVQIAATNVTCNLVLDFSPMRHDLISAGVIKTLCEHAKRSNSKLRQSSLWALKHLVLNAPQNVKHMCLEELGTGWLIQAVSGAYPNSGVPLAMGTSNAAGEQVDILNAPESHGMDVDWPEQGEDDEDDDGEVILDLNGTHYQSSSVRSTLDNAPLKTHLRLLRDLEQNPNIQAKHDDMLIQEQALDLIRNLVNGDDNVAMIDYLNDVIGTERIFDMLYTKLKPVQLPTPGNHVASSSQWQPPELINAALGVIVHLAGGSSKHRQQLIAQKSLLNAWLPHFSHQDRRIRVASVWAVINLTWVESTSDRDDAKQRALELKAVGIDEKVRALTNDSDLDTRERVKTAVRQMDELLEGGRYR